MTSIINPPSEFDLFFSYSTKDQDVAFSLVEELESMGVRCWIAPRNIPTGGSWAGAIIDGLMQSPVFLLLLTESSNLSRQVLREVERAIANGSTIIPVRLGDVEMSKDMQYYLSTIQWIDLCPTAIVDCARDLAGIVNGAPAQQLQLGKATTVESERRHAEEGQPEIISDNFLLPALTAAAAITVAIVSSVMAYFIDSTPTWSLRFDQLGNSYTPIGTGFSIDVIRMVFFVLLTVFICWYRLHEHFMTFMNPRIQTWRVNAFRAIFLAIAVFFGATETRRHLSLDLAPSRMCDWATENGLTTTPEAEVVPYRAFLAYSLVSYTFILPSLVAIPFYAFSRGLKDLRVDGQKLLPENSKGRTNQKILNAFSNYERECERECGRYIDVLGIGALSVHFEYWIGNWTMSAGGMGVLRVGWLAEFTGIATLIWIAWLYSNAVGYTKDSLLNSQSSNSVCLSDQKNGLSFVKTVFLSGPGGLLLLSLLIPWVHSITNR